ncbi:hypothetical protein [Massilia sp. DD77]|uniref:hypothetical protein n=1 Tax=Massilia sp. DD77 TaxID=3109349 RepID=UPI002FFE167E
MSTQRLSTWLALRCREPLFQRFLRVPDEQTAAHSVRAICEVKSRGEIDKNPTAAERFHQFIRLPFLQFQQNPNNQTTTTQEM